MSSFSLFILRYNKNNYKIIFRCLSFF